MLKTIFLKISNIIIVSCLTILGFAVSCKKQPDEYGTPYAVFKVNGNVTNNQSNDKISGIRVIMNSDTSYTDSNGFYSVLDKWGFPSDQTYYIHFQDIDSITNGSFNNLDTAVHFINPTFSNGDGNWYSGETSKVFDVKLNPKP